MNGPQQMMEVLVRGRHTLCRTTGRSGFAAVAVHDDPSDLFAEAMALSGQRYDVYLGVNPVHEQVRPPARGKTSDITDVSVLVADIDWFDATAHVDGALPDEATTRAKMRTFPIEPSIVVNSGHGFQAYWLFDHPIGATKAGQMNKALIDGLKAHGLAAEGGDVARVLRVPGTLNWKVPTDPKPVTMEFFDPELRYFVENLTHSISKLPKPKAGAHAGFGRATGAVKVAAELGRARKELRTEGRHPVMVEALGRLVAYERQSYDGAAVAIEALKKAFFDAKAGDYEHDTIEGEWNRAYDGAVAWCNERNIAARPDGFPTAWNDAEVGEAFADHIRGRFLWVKAWGWMRWDQRRWVNDDTDSVKEEVRRWVIERSIEAAGVGDDGTMAKAAARYKQKARMDAVVDVASRVDGVAASPEDFNGHPDLLNVLNGVVDLRTGELRQHDPELRLTKLAGAAYEPDACHPDVEAIIDAVDLEVGAWLQTFFGYGATGRTAEDVVVVFDGTGANGKTALIRAVAAALGDYAGAAPTRLVMHSAAQDHPTIEADLFGQRLVYIEETPQGGQLQAEKIKSLSGGGRLKARWMYRDYFEFTPTHKLLLATNHRPKVNTGEYALWRRLRRVPFTYRYVDRPRPGGRDRRLDRGLRQRLEQREQSTAMLAWVVEGARRWYANGLGKCTVIDEATNDWQLEEDVIGRFLAECCAPSPEGYMSGQEMYCCYEAWCADEGRPSKSNKNFIRELMDHPWIQAHDITKTKPKGVARYKGFRFRTPDDPANAWTADGVGGGWG